MQPLPETDIAARDILDRITAQIQRRLAGRVRDFQLIACNQGLILRGHTRTYYEKQIAPHAVMETTDLPIAGNEIDVS